MTLHFLRDIPHWGNVADEKAITLDGFSAYEGDCVTSNDEVLCLKGEGGTARVQEVYSRAPGKEVVFRGSVSNRLFSLMGSVQTPYNRASIMHEISSAFGWN